MLWQRITGRGMVVRIGTLTTTRGFSLPEHIVKTPFAKIKYAADVSVHYFELRFSEVPDVINGYINRKKSPIASKRASVVAFKYALKRFG